MTSKKWLVLFFATLLLLGACVVGLNFWVDPFGVFRHKALEWPSYEMTLNPRTAKITYLKDHHDEYDSYILGCSSTSSFPVDKLNQYLDARFYNMIMYGADMLDVEQQAVYLIENYEVKNLVINLFLGNASVYDDEADPLSYAMPPETTGENAAAFYAKYLFMDPRHSADKLNAMRKDTYLTQSFDVFDPESGAYDKKVRDAEPIGSLENYYGNYPVFANYPKDVYRTEAYASAATLESLAHVRDLCAERGIRLLVLTAPMYYEHLNYYDFADAASFFVSLAQVVPYWDFTYSSVSFEPRYFYDATHFRNSVGDMALARVFGDGSLYIPEDFGTYVTAENAQAHWDALAQLQPPAEEDTTADVPVLMYHHLDATGSDPAAVTPELFEAQIAALTQAGYTTVFPRQLQDYVERGAPLPEKPVVLTFDDGYLSNYEYAWPILQKYGQRATIFAIGATAGNTQHYKDTDFPITPHFSWEQGREMVESGTISIQSHTFDMHQWAPYETDLPARENILPFEGESEGAYRSALSADCAAIRSAITEGTGEARVHVLAYPSGRYCGLAQVTLLENGFDITFTTEEGSNTLVKGLPQSLLGLHRYTMSETVSVEQTLEWASSARG